MAGAFRSAPQDGAAARALAAPAAEDRASSLVVQVPGTRHPPRSSRGGARRSAVRRRSADRPCLRRPFGCAFQRLAARTNANRDCPLRRKGRLARTARATQALYRQGRAHHVIAERPGHGWFSDCTRVEGRFRSVVVSAVIEGSWRKALALRAGPSARRPPTPARARHPARCASRRPSRRLSPLRRPEPGVVVLRCRADPAIPAQAMQARGSPGLTASAPSLHVEREDLLLVVKSAMLRRAPLIVTVLALVAAAWALWPRRGHAPAAP